MTSKQNGKLNKLALFRDLGYEPHAGQIDMHMSEAPRRVLACGVRFGKTLSAAMEGLAAALQPCERSVGWVVAPTYDLADRVFREIQYAAAQHVGHRVRVMRESDRKLLITNMSGGVSEVRAKSADNPVSLLGEGLDWLIVDEASRLKPVTWESHLSQRLIDKKGWALLISTPKGKGWFYDAFRRGQGLDPDYESWNSPSWTNPLLDREFIERERDRLPERVFAQEYAAEFVEGAGAVFRSVRECATGELQGPQPGERYYGGLDLAKVQDYTVLVIMNSKREVVFVDRFHRLDWALQIARVKAAAERYNDCRVLVDTTGAGEPVFESMRQEGLSVSPYPFTAKSKSELINGLSILMEKQDVVLPRPTVWPEGIEELEAFEYSVTDQGNVRSGAPPGFHDDCVMALALAAWQLRPRAKRQQLIGAPPRVIYRDQW